jgi:hypothetical protein
VRERLLRRSAVGYDFFERLHYDYYAFSPEVARAMAGEPRLLDDIATYYVGPLTASLTLAHDRLVRGVSPRVLADRLIAGIAPALRDAPADIMAEALRVLTARDERAGDGGASSLPRAPAEAMRSAFVRWALMDPVAMYLTAVSEQRQEVGAAQLGTRMAGRLDRWASRLPITPVWDGLSDDDCRHELEFLAEILLRSPGARRRFARRLASESGDPTRCSRLLCDARFISEATT